MFTRDEFIKALQGCPNGDDPVVMMQIGPENLDEAQRYVIEEIHNTPEGLILLRSHPTG